MMRIFGDWDISPIILLPDIMFIQLVIT